MAGVYPKQSTPCRYLYVLRDEWAAHSRHPHGCGLLENQEPPSKTPVLPHTHACRYVHVGCMLDAVWSGCIVMDCCMSLVHTKGSWSPFIVTQCNTKPVSFVQPSVAPGGPGNITIVTQCGNYPLQITPVGLVRPGSTPSIALQSLPNC